MFAARKEGKYEVISSAPSVNLTPMGNAVVPVPYPVSIKLEPSAEVVPYVHFNKKPVFVKRSTTTKVKGDEKGSKKGVVSGTVNGEAVSIEFAPTVKVDGSNLIREQDLYWMQKKNTIGKLTTTDGGSGGSISAGGDVVGPCNPPDMGGTQGASAWDKALSGLSDPTAVLAKVQDLKSKYETVAGMLSGDIPFSAAALTGIAGSISGNHALMQASSALGQAETAKAMIDGDIPFSPAFALGMAASATGNPQMAAAANTMGMVEEGVGIARTAQAAIEGDEKATASLAMSGVGSLMGSPLLLATVQSIHHYALPSLVGVLPIELTIVYVSDRLYQGVFGIDRRHSYEKQFYALDHKNYRLDLPDGRWFRFIKQEDGTFIDKGKLGVTVTEIDSNTLVLHYYDGSIEHYHHKELVKIEDSNGNSIEFVYSDTPAPRIKCLTKIVNSSGAFFTLEYNEQGFIKRITDHDNRTWLFNYNKYGYLTQIIIDKQVEEQYNYHFIERKGFPQSYQLTSIYDASKQLKLAWHYNKQGEVTGYQEKEQHFEYLWHHNDQIEKRNKDTGKSIIYGLDATRRVSAITYPDATYTKEVWDKELHQATLKTRSGKTIVKQFDKRNRLLSLSENDVLKESYSYEGDNPNPISSTKEQKEPQTTLYEYDKAYNLTKVTYPDERTHEYTYTKEGLKASSIDSEGNSILYEYNPQAMLVKQVDAQGNPIAFEYDALGRIRNIVLANGVNEAYHYNRANQLIRYTNGAGEHLEFSYSQSGKLESIKDPAKRVTQYRYDKYDRVITKVYPHRYEDTPKMESYSYNRDNTLSTITRIDGSRLYFNYDAYGNIVTILADNHQGKVEELNYSYDKDSKLTKALHGNRKIELEYNKENQIVSQIQNSIIVDTIYDRETQQLKQLGFLEQECFFEYNDSHSIKEIKTPNSKIEFEYHKSGTLQQRTYPNRVKEKFSYDKNHNLLTIESKPIQLSYRYNALNQIQTKHNHQDKEATLYRYNQRGELIQAGRRDFAYSRAGNQIAENYLYNHDNQLIACDRYHYRYDQRGNLKEKIHKITQARVVYSFNLFNQLTGVQHYSHSNQTLESFEYAYDALNRRVKKVHTKGTNQTIHHYLYDNHNIVAILDKNKKLLASIIHDSTIDTPLSITTHQNPLRELTEIEQSYYYDLPKADRKYLDTLRAKRTYYYHRDHQGSIHSLTNEAGEIVESFRYDEAYGVILEHSKTEETLNPYAYTGREFDTAELYYYRARYYDPTIGRFISSDPIEFLAGDFNFYRYVGNKPTMFRDPLGLEEVGYFEALGDSLSESWNSFNNDREAIGTYDQHWGSDALQHVGNGLGLIGDAVTSVVWNEKTEQVANDTVDYVQSTETYQDVTKAGGEFLENNPNIAQAIDTAGQKVDEGMAYVGQKMNEVAEEHPEFARNVGAVVEGAGVIPGAGKAANLAGKGLKKAAKKVMKSNKNKSSSDSGSGVGSVANSDGGDGTIKVTRGDGKEPTKEQIEQCKAACPIKSTGNPINTIFGSKVLSQEIDNDFTINAPLPLEWQRTYSSDNPRVGLLGQGWQLEIDLTLIVKENKTVFTDVYGREIKFDNLEVGEKQFFPLDKWTLIRKDEMTYEFQTSSGVNYLFQALKQDEGIYRLTKTFDRNSNQISYFYNSNNEIQFIATDNYRLFEIKYITLAEAGLRISKVIEHLMDKHIHKGKKLIEVRGICYELSYQTGNIGQPQLHSIEPCSEKRKRTLLHEKVPFSKPKKSLIVQYEFSKEGDLIEVSNQYNESTRKFSYRNHMMTSHEQRSGLISHYKYDEYTPKGKVIENWTNQGEHLHLTYEEQQTVVTDKLGRKEIFKFDEDKYITQKVDALGQSIGMEYNDDGLLDKLTDKAGQTKEYQRDAQGNPVVIKNSKGQSLQISYNDDGQPIEIQNSLGGTTKLEYDKRGNLTKKSLPNGSETAFIRDARGLPIEIVDTAKQSSYFEYDLSGNLIAYTNKSGQTRTYGYDREDRLTYTKDALNQKTEYLYRKENLTQVIYPDNSMVKLEYDKQNRVIAHTDRDGKVTKYHYNQQGKLSQKEDALNNTLNYNYDQAGRLEELINENQESYHFEYDPLDRLIKEQGLDGLSSEYNYDEINNLTKKIVTTIDNQTQETILSHNPIGEYSTKTVTLGDKTSQSAYRYDLLGNLIEAVNRTNRVLFEYNEMGQISKEITELTENEEDIERVLEHEYDELGNRIKTILPDKREVEWIYNELGSVQEILIDKKTITTIQRDELNRELRRTQGVLESFKEYDSLGRLVNQSTYNQSDILDINENNIDFAFEEIDPLLQRSYSYNRAGELSEIHDRRKGKTTYSYDSIGRILETVTPLETETFNFDPAHNLLDPDNPEQERVKHNQIVTYQDKRYEYDSFGNLTNKKIGSHTNIDLIYDAEHQLIESQVTKDNSTKIYNYDYDPFGRRSRKKDEEGTTHFIWNGNRLLTEQREDESQTYIYEQNSFTPLAHVDTQNNIHYYHTDHIGTPREMTNEEGEIIWEAQYKTWGNIAQESCNQRDSRIQFQPLRFQGQYFDAETGLHYNRFRYYDPDIGRFISQDPIGLIGGSNLYQYAPNPTGWVDPFGLHKFQCVCPATGEVIELTSEEKAMNDLLEKDAEEHMNQTSQNKRNDDAAISRAMVEGKEMTQPLVNIKPKTLKDGTVKGMDGVSVENGVATIYDREAYLNSVDKLYRENGEKKGLNSDMRTRINEHLISLPNGEVQSKNGGLPGLHAEVRTTNQLMNQGYKMNEISVGTRKVGRGNKDTKEKDPFVACSNCDGILNGHVNKITTGGQKKNDKN